MMRQLPMTLMHHTGGLFLFNPLKILLTGMLLYFFYKRFIHINEKLCTTDKELKENTTWKKHRDLFY